MQITSKRKRNQKAQKLSKSTKKTCIRNSIDTPTKRAVLHDASIRKRTIPHPINTLNKMFISRKTLLMSIIKKMRHKLISEPKGKPIILYAQSAAIERALEAALILSYQIPLNIQVETGTIEVVDDVLPYDLVIFVLQLSS
ncbi:uncharacterized protein T551_01416 [Pneumocystis jirovecii RU7]|uniref:Uncharacterized protein n=1 Tax=Pneumocystis jirovecii (strain RU7) TaxID=1408657 RepID=A0A0W4ZSK8_PNEJ7|nr:uncharacterized protein T551_01416 [Pneumocystis jirovecii RU7]KTW31344.1 hypothetical protein T551_01416 [Pneumocystis jirovecii RU7]